MKGYKIQVYFVLNGNYDKEDVSDLIEVSINGNHISERIRYKIKPVELMNAVVKKKYSINTDFKGNICGDCIHMLKCPKVMDNEKKPLKSYGYITDGLELLLIDIETRKQYINAVKEYKDKLNYFDFDLDDDTDLKRRLQNSGVDVPIISVFGCKNFLPDDVQYVKKPKKNK